MPGQACKPLLQTKLFNCYNSGDTREGNHAPFNIRAGHRKNCNWDRITVITVVLVKCAVDRLITLGSAKAYKNAQALGYE